MTLEKFNNWKTGKQFTEIASKSSHFDQNEIVIGSEENMEDAMLGKMPRAVEEYLKKCETQRSLTQSAQNNKKDIRYNLIKFMLKKLTQSFAFLFFYNYII